MIALALSLTASLLMWRFVSKLPPPGETAAVTELRTLNAAMRTYASTYSKGFPDTLHRLNTPSGYGKPTYNNAGLFRYLPHVADPRVNGRIFTRLATNLPTVRAANSSATLRRIQFRRGQWSIPTWTSAASLPTKSA